MRRRYRGHLPGARRGYVPRTLRLARSCVRVRPTDRERVVLSPQTLTRSETLTGGGAPAYRVPAYRVLRAYPMQYYLCR